METVPQLIDSRYRVLKSLGGGGFSEVFLVEGPDGPCALKLLKGNVVSLKKSTLEEFRHEFSILKDMRHPHIAGIMDFGFDEGIERYYYTSEYIEGVDFYRSTNEMRWEQVADLVVQALRALEYLHSYRIHHFDIKAANVFIMGKKNPIVKIIDFGLAGLDPQGKIIGTPSYMPPEIAERAPADRRADLYSLGVLWYSSLARKNPFRASSTEETIARQLSLIPPPPSAANPLIPKWIDAIILRLLEKNPANRYQSAQAVIRDINRLGEKHYELETQETLLSYLPDEGRFVGRTEELARLEGAADELKVQAKDEARCFLLLGEKGVGRSRMLTELKYRLQLKDLHVFHASASDGADFAEWCNRLDRHLSEGKGTSVFLLDDAERTAADEAMSARLIQLLYAAKRPAPETRALIAMAMRQGEGASPEVPLAAVAHERILLRAFTREELSTYLVTLTGLADPPRSLMEGIYRRTEGNPFFVTEIIRALIAGGGLFDEHGRWKETLFEDVGVDFSRAIVSDTVGDLLLGRIGSLAPDDRRLLVVLSAADAPASAAELGAWGGVDDPHPKAFGLLQAGLVERLDGFVFQFSNALMGQLLYDRMPPAECAAIHDRIAAGLAAEGADAVRILHHRSLGGDRSAAAEAAIALGDMALAAGQGREASWRLARALACSDPEDFERQVVIRMKLGEAALIGHDYDAAREHFTVVESLVARNAADAKTSSWRADALIRLGGTYIKLQEPGRARVAFGDAKDALRLMGGDRRRELVIDNFLAALLFQDGRYEEARRIFEGAREAWTGLDRADRAQVNNNDLGMVLAAMGEIDEAKRILDDDLVRAGELGDDLLIGRAHYHLAQLSLARRDFSAAVEAFERCAEVCRHSENTELLLRAYNGLGNTFHITGDLAQSIEYYERGLSLHERAGDLRGGAAIAVNVGIVETARGNIEAALDRLIPAVDFLRALVQKSAVDWMALARGLLELGDVWHRKGKDEKARAALEEARGIASHVPKAASLRFWILATQAEVALAEGEASEVAQLVGMLRPLAQREDEKKKIEELAAQMGRSAESASEPSAASRPVSSPSPVVAPPSTAVSPAAPPAPRRAERLEAQAYRRILEVNKLIAVESDLDYVLKTVLFYALELARAEAGAVLLLNEAGDLSTACERNMAGGEPETQFSQTLARQAISTGNAVTTDNAMEDERFAAEASVAAHNLRSILCLPVRARGRIIGALYLDHRYQAGAFSGVDMGLITAFADQVGLAIETARLLAEQARRERDLRDELSEASRRVEHYQELLEEQQGEKLDLGPLVGRSHSMMRVLRTVTKIADTDLSVFLCGETGTGKELIARALHSNHRERKGRRFVAINCGAIPQTLIESELFGYKAGAFTGAARDKRGLIEEANGGTLFLDEIGELDIQLQVKLLRVLQERECTRVGDTQPRAVDVRIVAASNRDIETMVKEGTFREDLYYRLCQMRIDIPPLRERPEDLMELVSRFLREAAPGRTLKVHPQLVRRFLAYRWPGNIRELQNLIQVAVALSEGDLIDERAVPDNHPIARSQPKAPTPLPPGKPEAPQAEKAPAAAASPPVSDGSPKIDEENRYHEGTPWKEYERLITAKCYAANDFRAKMAAAELGISTATFYNRIKEWDLDDRANPAYAHPFVYARGRKIDDYLPLIFAAALAAAGGKPSQAIANLRVSQGYFYKVMKRVKER